MSYGVVLVKHEEDDSKILMLQRKDSLCYIDFIRGKYNLYDVEYILKLCNHFSIHEKEAIMTHSFDELWTKLWMIDKHQIKTHIKNEYKKGKDKFMKLQKGFMKDDTLINIQYLYDNMTTTYETCEWEFPKGRRNENEKNRECAIREFQEETNIVPSTCLIFPNITPLSEEYYGENNIKYKHVYYLGILMDPDVHLYIDASNCNQVNEVSDIQWLTKAEAYSKIRSYNTTKYDIINTVFEFADNYRQDLSIY